MATQPIQSDVLRLDRVFRSDTLPTLRKFLEMVPDLKSLVDQSGLQISAIVDTNRIFADLLWKLSKRKAPRNRSSLDEDLDSGIFVLFAPDYLEVEIQEKFPTLTEQTGASVADVEHEWARLRAKLHFYRPLTPLPEGWSADSKDLPPNREFVDPKDLPYLYASRELGLPVFTSDRHLGAMGAPVLWFCIDTSCRDSVRTDTATCGHARFDTAVRDHARSTSVTIGFTLGSTFTVTIGVETLQAAARGIKSLLDYFRRQPAWLQLLVTGAIAAIVIHPKSRAKLVQAWESACGAVSEAKEPVFEGVIDLIQQFATAQSDAARTLGQIQDALPPAKKATAIVHARRICVVSPGPVPIEEIVRRMRNEGYVSRAKCPEVYLRRVMRKSGQFIEASPRMFELRG